MSSRKQQEQCALSTGADKDVTCRKHKYGFKSHFICNRLYHTTAGVSWRYRQRQQTEMDSKFLRNAFSAGNIRPTHLIQHRLLLKKRWIVYWQADNGRRKACVKTEIHFINCFDKAYSFVCISERGFKWKRSSGNIEILLKCVATALPLSVFVWKKLKFKTTQDVFDLKHVVIYALQLSKT